MKKINGILHSIAKYDTPWIPYNEFKNIIEIDRGGSSIICKAKWIRDPKPRDVILKLFNKDKHFINEINAYNKLGVKNPSRYYGISENEEKKHIIILKHIQMGSLKKNFEKITQQNMFNKLTLLHNIILDLKTIHDNGILHKDIHPNNILLEDLTNAYIIEFGLSSSFDEIKNDEIEGIIPYIPPEVLLGRKYTPASDIFSFGVVMVETLTGQNPFSNDAVEFGLKIYSNSQQNYIPKTLDHHVDLAYQCINFDPAKRPTINDIMDNIKAQINSLSIVKPGFKHE